MSKYSSINNDSVHFNKTFGITISDNKFYPRYSFSFRFFENYYLFIKNKFLSNISNNTNLVYHNGFIQKDQRNFGYVGYENKWINIQVGKDNENWGAGDNISLALCKFSNTYDYFLLASNYGRVRVRYIHGFLERTANNINRYITARGIEWTNNSSLLAGISETVVYSGYNRTFDYGYFNPISSHLELELNNRLNFLGNSNSNAVWQFHYDWKPSQRLRFSFNYLLDEFVMDPDVELNKEHGKAFSSKISYFANTSNGYPIKICASIIAIGTPTFRHGEGTNNFVQKGRPTGSQLGSDVQDINIKISLYKRDNNELALLSLGYIETGQENINRRVFDSYDNYTKGTFPSGNITKAYYFDSSFKYEIIDNFTFLATVYMERYLNNNFIINSTIGMIYSF